MGSYQAISEYAYNDICKEEFGKDYTFYGYDASMKIITCEKKTGSGFSIKKTMSLTESDLDKID